MASPSCHSFPVPSLSVLHFPHPPPHQPITPFLVTESQVIRLLRSQDSQRAPGPDSVSLSALKYCADQLTPVFTHIFNISLELCRVPACFKAATIIPIPKKAKGEHGEQTRKSACSLRLMLHSSGSMEGLQNKNALSGCRIAEKYCVKLISTQRSNPSHLRELNLSENKPKDSGVKHLCDLLKHSDCRLEKLMLCRCRITEKHCVKLMSALCSNPSHLRELNLSQNQIKDTGVNHLCNLLKNPHCSLEKLYLNKCEITNVASLAKTLADTTTTTTSLRLLDLSNNDINDSSLNQLREVLKRSNCELILQSKDC
ncbi:ribonuclease inhibitor-like [Misgurnus anguillicaudatus]|uniref:ribonuclease inhibitor-like n=1 Tax=Misgurnus anguillicaudatus TaxID=75329 RepID=UPI003CCFC9B6